MTVQFAMKVLELLWQGGTRIDMGILLTPCIAIAFRGMMMMIW